MILLEKNGTTQLNPRSLNLGWFRQGGQHYLLRRRLRPAVVKRVGESWLVAKGGGLMFENLGKRLVFFGFISDVCFDRLVCSLRASFIWYYHNLSFCRCFVTFWLCAFFLTQCRINIGLEHLEVLILFSRWHLYQTAQVSAGWSDSMTTLHRVVCFCGDVPATKNQSQVIFESSCTEEQS